MKLHAYVGRTAPNARHVLKQKNYTLMKNTVPKTAYKVIVWPVLRNLSTNGEDESSVGMRYCLLYTSPHTVELMPSEASGSRNYQGPAWYRKHFTIDTKYQGKRLSLYFEAIMGKSSFYVNGQKVKEHFGGFLPVTIDLTRAGVKAGDDVIIAVCADNSDDPSFPPGRKQYTMDSVSYTHLQWPT